MSPHAIVATALMLGMMVLAAGAYGLLYCVARLYGSPILRAASRASCVALGALAAAIVVMTPLHFGWKALIVASGVAYLAIPPITWRYLTRLHRGGNDASRPVEHADRARTRLYRRA
jgi:hypothetical protein